MNLAAGNVGHLRIEQRRERAQDAALGLSAQSEQDEIVARKNGVDDLRNDGVVIADDAGEDGPSSAQASNQVLAHFVLYAAGAQTLSENAGCGEARPRSAEDCSRAGYLRGHGPAILASRTG